MRRGLRAILIGLVAGAASAASAAEQTVWRFDNLQRVRGFATEVEGEPRVVDSPVGKALQFDGKDDSLFIAGRPLVGASAFTIEAIVRPEGGKFEQRFMHIAETNPATGLDAAPAGVSDTTPRFMFEVRVVEGGWYLDAFVNSKAGSKALIFPDKVHPLGRWYAVAQTYDGKTYRAYVDGVLEGEAEVPFTPHGPGHVRVGARMNHVDYFMGSIAQARFTDRALPSDALLKVAN
jgi:hypothetical protein